MKIPEFKYIGSLITVVQRGHESVVGYRFGARENDGPLSDDHLCARRNYLHPRGF